MTMVYPHDNNATLPCQCGLPLCSLSQQGHAPPQRSHFTQFRWLRASSQLTAAFYVLWSKPITKQTNIIPITAFHLHIRLPLDYIHVHLSYHGDRIHLLANRRSEKVNTFNPYNRGGRRHSHTTRIPLPPLRLQCKKGGTHQGTG